MYRIEAQDDFHDSVSSFTVRRLLCCERNGVNTEIDLQTQMKVL
ncbi:7302_t:CDS:2 [Ambispora gerdemannii]|uniref:7302_t:CDS:1 n=1 Tax=Ambispora gerdemannii TaxID=144530 RepID=A0A9N9FPE4_9GLOM|nr:7302_t:CDS:2 [Ambispora gerdemannii]